MAFMAECFWPGVTAQKVVDAGERVRQAADPPNFENGFARYLGSILIPTDEIALVFLESTSIAAATELAQHATLPSERILEIVRLGAFLASSPDNLSSSKELL
jgi:hypothetical protein